VIIPSAHQPALFFIQLGIAGSAQELEMVICDVLNPIIRYKITRVIVNCLEKIRANNVDNLSLH